jgi:hypothetical protein
MATPPDFTAGQVLTAAQMNAVGLWLVKAQTVGSAVSSVTVTDAFNADFVSYRIIYSGGTASTTVGDLNMILGATVTGYYWGSSRVLYNGGTFQGTGSGAAAAALWRVGAMTSTRTNLNIDVLQPFATTQTSFSGISPFIGGGASYSLAILGGYLDNTTSYTAFTLSPNTGTISGGTISVYGYNI